MFHTPITFNPLTYEEALAVCCSDSNFLENVPICIVDYKLCLILAEYHGFVLADTPKHYRDYNLCLIASTNNSIDEGIAYNTPEYYWKLIQNKQLHLLINTL